MHRDWARPFHICTGTGSPALLLARCTSVGAAPIESGKFIPHDLRLRLRTCCTCAGTSPKATRTAMPRMIAALRQKAALRRNSAPRAALRRWPSSLRPVLAARSGCLHVDGTPACRLHRRRRHGSHSGSLVPPQLGQIPTQHPWPGSGLRAAKRAAPGGRAPGLSNARLCDHSAGSVGRDGRAG